MCEFILYALMNVVLLIGSQKKSEYTHYNKIDYTTEGLIMAELTFVLKSSAKGHFNIAWANTAAVAINKC